MSGPAIKYYTVVVPAKGALARLNEAGAAGHMLCHLEHQPAERTVRFILAMPRQWEEEPWCPPQISREIAKLQNRMQRTLDEASKERDVAVPHAQLQTWIKWIDDIMNPKPEKPDDDSQ